MVIIIIMGHESTRRLSGGGRAAGKKLQGKSEED
jgi:hypothetical protein